MSPERVRPQAFICKGCGVDVQRRPSPARDLRSEYCSLACKMSVWWRTHKRKVYPPTQRRLNREYSQRKLYRACKACGEYCLPGRNGRLCGTCYVKMKYRPCVQCGRPVKSICETQKTCSNKCRHQWLSGHLQGKAYKPQVLVQRVCPRCQKTFSSRAVRGGLRCPPCTRAVSPGRTHGKHEKRAKRAGVPYVYGIKPEQVFARDGWRCQLCGCSTPKRLRGQMVDRAPELDHIVPLSAGGSHSWDNVQCACRKCNMDKGANAKGQLRLAV